MVTVDMRFDPDLGIGGYGGYCIPKLAEFYIIDEVLKLAEIIIKNLVNTQDMV